MPPGLLTGTSSEEKPPMMRAALVWWSAEAGATAAEVRQRRRVAPARHRCLDGDIAVKLEEETFAFRTPVHY